MLFLITLSICVSSLANYLSVYWDPRLKPAYPPNYCVDGTERLKWYQPIPGFFGIGMMLRHQRSGGKVIWRYVAGEYATVLLVGLAAWQIGWHPELAVAVWLTAILVIIVQTDLTNMIIPNKVVFVGLAGVAALRLISHPLPWHEYAIGAVAGSGALLLIAVVGQWLLKREAMGGGDIKLYLFIGAALGWKLTLLSLFLASAIGFVAGLAAMMLGGHQAKDRTFPFGPSIAVGALVAYYWGDGMLNWYWTLLTVAG